jgi:cation transport regulator ChaC
MGFSVNQGEVDGRVLNLDEGGLCCGHVFG